MLDDNLVGVQDVKDTDLVSGVDRKLLHVASGKLQGLIRVFDDQKRLAAMINTNLQQRVRGI